MWGRIVSVATYVALAVVSLCIVALQILGTGVGCWFKIC